MEFECSIIAGASFPFSQGAPNSSQRRALRQEHLIKHADSTQEYAPYSHPGQVCNGVASWVSQQGDDSSQIASEWETTAQRRTKPMYVTCRNSVCGILLWTCRIVPQVVLSSLAHMHNHAVCCTKNVAHPMAYLHSHKGCRV